MKLHKISYLLMGAALLTAACDDINKMQPQSGNLTYDQVLETNEAVPQMTEATYASMFNMMGQAYLGLGSGRGRADDFAFVMAAISLDFEGADFMMDDNGYCWFSTFILWNNT